TAGTAAYLSINNGTTNIVSFNDGTTNGGDYGDWVVHSPAQVNDYAGTPGAQPNLGSSEIRNLDVIGYDLAALAAPEPGSVAMLGTIGVGASVLGVWRWKRRGAGPVA